MEIDVERLLWFDGCMVLGSTIAFVTELFLRAYGALPSWLDIGVSFGFTVGLACLVVVNVIITWVKKE
jgi:hypothetical protein